MAFAISYLKTEVTRHSGAEKSSLFSQAWHKCLGGHAEGFFELPGEMTVVGVSYFLGPLTKEIPALRSNCRARLYSLLPQVVANALAVEELKT